ncbi:hypothetical protein [Mesorhizobium onobrychidis]|uniref:Uncharacterized protein n=1 Tax=Mesorhizobium onobrychidis TaxID=2775404 RepID=A0ABY5R4R4_9HYPH|nr:hypothetical protein [Mesorhizobium onobrychidis]UVC18303.1 hypothetical protein IHQ72_15215 [Mesorhizobium onobrychidis]
MGRESDMAKVAPPATLFIEVALAQPAVAGGTFRRDPEATSLVELRMTALRPMSDVEFSFAAY